MQQPPLITVSNYLWKRWSLDAFTGAIAQMKQEERHLCNGIMSDIPGPYGY